MAIGDVDSNDAGSGARYNDGKPMYDLIPVRTWLVRWMPDLRSKGLGHLHGLLVDLRDFQEGDDEALQRGFANVDRDDWLACVSVLEHGIEKYAAWNWAKGMPWSVPIGCSLRHAEKILMGETIDDDSGLAHIGHMLANHVFLDWYAHYWRSGDDRPPRPDQDLLVPTAGRAGEMSPEDIRRLAGRMGVKDAVRPSQPPGSYAADAKRAAELAGSQSIPGAGLRDKHG